YFCCLPPLFSSCPFRVLPLGQTIRTAIGTLNDRDGSSKKAIAKFIEQAYPRLPSTHPALLTQHSNRLKTSGRLVMVKKSYMLPKSDASPSAAQRRRGRPPKRKPNADLLPQPGVRQNANPVFFALGLEDEPANPEVIRKGPGRPPNAGTNIVDQPGPSARRGRPPGSKRPGRPPKRKSESAFSNGTKRRPGRPPKNETNVRAIPFAPPGPAVPAETVTASIGTSVPPDASLPSISPRGRGRPKKSAAAVPPQAVGHGSGGSGHGRSPGGGLLPGRPPPTVAGVRRPKDPALKSVGRPKKGTFVEHELRRKLEYFQLKVNESLGSIKPHFNIASPVSAIAAIQELEGLATMDLNVPLRNETQELLPQQ
ncbi:uncharacterized protein LOC129314952, partial [Prosopis cineraria]|uniref:uncharacterized protein LOC129314952 n=1 Tax=Prosopis cineraria TaxID=364024 RepID=UPI00240F5DBE